MRDAERRVHFTGHPLPLAILYRVRRFVLRGA
jgi:hypothetical protein